MHAILEADEMAEEKEAEEQAKISTEAEAKRNQQVTLEVKLSLNQVIIF